MHVQSTVRNKSLQTLAFIFHVGVSLPPISMQVYLHQIQNFLRRAFRLAKSSIILLTSSFPSSAFSIDKTARPLNLSSCIMFRRYVSINFNLENDLSAVATVTGNVRNRRNYFFIKIAIGSSLVGPQGSWVLVHRTTCTTCMAATDYDVTRSLCAVHVRLFVPDASSAHHSTQPDRATL